MESELTRLTLAEASSLVRHKKVSPLELTEACLRGIEESDSQLNAFITVAADEAVMSARRAGEEIAKGDHRGPLHGIPVAVKDLFDRAGARTTYGSEIFAEHVPSADAAAVAFTDPQRRRIGGQQRKRVDE